MDKKKIQVTLARSAGFCFGVRRALQIALKTAQSKKPVLMLGDLVHNEEVVQLIKKAGIRKVRRLENGRGKTLIIRAHGASAKISNRARRAGYNVVDATCLMVQEIHKIARTMEKKGFSIIIIGDKKHDEVVGVIGQLKKPALTIDTEHPLPTSKLKKIKKAAVLVQSTQNEKQVLSLIKKIKTLIPSLRFFNTICGPTKIKQKEIRTLPLTHDVMIVIGSKSSANTKRLYEIAHSLNTRTYWVQSAQDLKPAWFQKTRSVAITAGASTPDNATQAVLRRIRKITRTRQTV